MAVESYRPWTTPKADTYSYAGVIRIRFKGSAVSNISGAVATP
jgi:hypothetical protein